MPDASVDCVVTSPPYWGLRDLNPEYAAMIERRMALITPSLFAEVSA
jgi:DNA modification methylase